MKCHIQERRKIEHTVTAKVDPAPAYHLILPQSRKHGCDCSTKNRKEQIDKQPVLLQPYALVRCDSDKKQRTYDTCIDIKIYNVQSLPLVTDLSDNMIQTPKNI